MLKQWDNNRDYHSFANVDAVSVTHLSLSLAVDFQQQQLTGEVRLSLNFHDIDCRTLVLDGRDLHIDAVVDAQGRALEFSVGTNDAILGESITVALADMTESVTIKYRTDPSAQGLQWLTPQQTSGKTLPFLFSQSQPINARSWIPLQDTPKARIT